MTGLWSIEEPAKATSVIEPIEPANCPPMPIVDRNDECLDHGGIPNTCYACNAMAQTPHRWFCPYITKLVRVRCGDNTIECVVPWCWSRSEIEFQHRDKTFFELIDTLDDLPLARSARQHKEMAA